MHSGKRTPHDNDEQRHGFLTARAARVAVHVALAALVVLAAGVAWQVPLVASEGRSRADSLPPADALAQYEGTYDVVSQGGADRAFSEEYPDNATLASVKVEHIDPAVKGSEVTYTVVRADGESVTARVSCTASATADGGIALDGMNAGGGDTDATDRLGVTGLASLFMTIEPGNPPQATVTVANSYVAPPDGSEGHERASGVCIRR